ncbi:MAG: ATP-binding protein [Heliobacteriaceae bacterium]|nr:ATP-binding protein [Heliobacteriaceae bacterium]MDD4587481.1 ATP-binding protein [Heliobacteriaceae bacterium]
MRRLGERFAACLQWQITLAYILLVTLPFIWLFFLVEEGGGQVKTALLATAFFFFCFSTGLVYVWSGRLVRNLGEIKHSVERFADGENPKLYGLEAEHEIGQLAQALNGAVETVSLTVRRLTEEKNRFETVLESMVEGVVSFDQLGRIELLNRAGEKMLRTSAAMAKGKQLLAVVRNQVLEDALSKTLQTGLPGTEEVRLWPHQPQIFRVTLVPIFLKQSKVSGAVMVLNDVTEIRRLEQMRTQFVANVSHELHTPLTSIRGFIETLLDGAVDDPQITRRFLSIVATESLRLERLIEDLLLLSRLEHHHEPVIGGNTLAAPEINRVRTLLEPIAREKNVSLVTEIRTGLPQLAMAAAPLNQVLVNLVENAIKYTPAGGRVVVTAQAREKGALIEVIDTGIGIPPASLPRLFERFYRVDKARSRQMGGTGLGLAIVKHLVERAGGYVRVKSEVGKGTVFSVYLPGIKAVAKD